MFFLLHDEYQRGMITHVDRQATADPRLLHVRFPETPAGVVVLLCPE